MAEAYYEKTFGTTDMEQVRKIAKRVLFCDNDWCRFTIEGSIITIFVIDLDCIYDSCRKYCNSIRIIGKIIEKAERAMEKDVIVATINTFKSILQEVYGNVINDFLDIIHFVRDDMVCDQCRMTSLPVRQSDILSRKWYLLNDDARWECASLVYSTVLQFHSNDVFELKEGVKQMLRSFDTCVQVSDIMDNPYKIMIKVRKPSTGILSDIKTFFGFESADTFRCSASGGVFAGLWSGENTLAEHMEEKDAIGLFKSMLISKYPFCGEEFISMLVFDLRSIAALQK